MPIDKLYTIEEIKAAFDKYRGKKVLRILKDGKWKVAPLTHVDRIQGSRAEIVNLSTMQSFPVFLEKNYG